MRMWKRVITTAILGATIALGTAKAEAEDYHGLSLFPPDCMAIAYQYYKSVYAVIDTANGIDNEARLRNSEVVLEHAWRLRDSGVALMRSSFDILNCLLLGPPAATPAE